MVEKCKIYIKDYFSNSPKIILVIMLLIIGILIPVVNSKKTFVVSIDGETTQITTYKKTYNEALKCNKIFVGLKDKTSIGIDSEIMDKSTLSVIKAINVEVEVDGKQLRIQTAEPNISSMLYAEGIVVNDYDKVYPSIDSSIQDGLKVAITRVETKTIKDTESIDFSTVIRNDDSLEKGSNRVVQEGQKGQKQITTRIVYEDGKEVSKKLISDTITKEPVEKIVAMGTLGVYNLSRGGSVHYTKQLRMKSTAYSPYDSGSYKTPGNEHIEITAIGTIAKRNTEGYSSVAVDPSIIALGSKLYIPGYGYGIAEDTGGAIKGNRIDLFYYTRSEASDWGVRMVDVYILK